MKRGNADTVTLTVEEVLALAETRRRQWCLLGYYPDGTRTYA